MTFWVTSCCSFDWFSIGCSENTTILRSEVYSVDSSWWFIVGSGCRLTCTGCTSSEQHSPLLWTFMAVVCRSVESMASGVGWPVLTVPAVNSCTRLCPLWTAWLQWVVVIYVEAQVASWLCELNSISSLQLSFAHSYIVNENAASWVQINTNCIVRSTHTYTVYSRVCRATCCGYYSAVGTWNGSKNINWYTSQPDFALAFVTPQPYIPPLLVPNVVHTVHSYIGMCTVWCCGSSIWLLHWTLQQLMPLFWTEWRCTDYCYTHMIMVVGCIYMVVYCGSNWLDCMYVNQLLNRDHATQRLPLASPKYHLLYHPTL